MSTLRRDEFAVDVGENKKVVVAVNLDGKEMTGLDFGGALGYEFFKCEEDIPSEKALRTLEMNREVCKKCTKKKELPCGWKKGDDQVFRNGQWLIKEGYECPYETEHAVCRDKPFVKKELFDDAKH